MRNWQKIEEIFNEAVYLPTRERKTFLRVRCEGNAEIFSDVLQLLETDESEPQLFNTSAFALGAKLLGNEFSKPFLEQTFAHYRNLKMLSRGNPQAVFAAQNILTSELEVLKILPSVHSLDRQTIKRFKIEAEIAAAVTHPHIARVNNFDIFENHYYIAMEHITGRSMRAILKRGSISGKQAVQICRQIGSGLGALHRQGITHGDLKPENILISSGGKAKIVDFGTAVVFDEKLYSGDFQAVSIQNSDNMIIGTPAYMSPEQLRGLKAAPPADLWSLAMIMYEMISGTRLFAEASSGNIKKSLLSSNLRLAENLSPESLEFFNKCFAPDLSARYDCVCSLVEDFAGLFPDVNLT